MDWVSPPAPVAEPTEPAKAPEARALPRTSSFRAVRTHRFRLTGGTGVIPETAAFRQAGIAAPVPVKRTRAAPAVAEPVVWIGRPRPGAAGLAIAKVALTTAGTAIAAQGVTSAL